MGCEKSTSVMTVTAIAAVVTILCLLSTAQVQAQGEVPSCANSLVPCADYINATNPPSSCCKPLEETIKTQLTCLCGLFNQRELLKTFHINITEALSLPKRCKIAGASTSMCSSSPTSAPTGSPSSSGSSTSSSSSPSTPTDDSAAMSIGWSRVTSLLVFMAPLVMLC